MSDKEFTTKELIIEMKQDFKQFKDDMKKALDEIREFMLKQIPLNKEIELHLEKGKNNNFLWKIIVPILTGVFSSGLLLFILFLLNIFKIH
jgi:hypothetical protein